LLAVWPGAGSCQLCWLVNCHVVPGALSDGVRVTFHWPTGVTVSGKFSVIVQLLNAVVPVLVTLMSTWKKLPPVLDGVAVQLCAANAGLPSIRPDSIIPSLINVFIIPSLKRLNNDQGPMARQSPEAIGPHYLYFAYSRKLGHHGFHVVGGVGQHVGIGIRDIRRAIGGVGP
jgi:hypothetical protein